MSSSRRTSWAVVCLLLFFASAAGAHEADSIRVPSEAYDRAADLVKQEDYAKAAYYFARADAIDPNDVALKEALSAVLKASLPELGMALVERAAGRKSAELVRLTAKVKKRFASTTGKIHVECQPASCEVSVAGEPREPLHGDWVRVGNHDIVARWGSESARQSVQAKTGEVVEVKLAPEHSTEPNGAPLTTSAKQPEPERDRTTHSTKPTTKSGLGPTWFWVGVGVTAVLGAVTTWSALDTKAKHDDYGESPDLDLRDRGRSAQTRTNILLGATAVAAAGTTVIGVGFTNWGGAKSEQGRGFVIGATARLP